MLSLPAIAGQAIEPLAQLMETAYIGRLGESMSTSGRRQNLKYKYGIEQNTHCNQIPKHIDLCSWHQLVFPCQSLTVTSKLFNIPLLSVATSFVAEDTSNSASRTSACRFLTGEHCQRESGNGKPFAVINTHQQLSSVSMALVLAAAIGIFEALALSLGSGLFLNLLGILPASSRFVNYCNPPPVLDLAVGCDSSMHVPEQALGAPAVVVSLALQGIFHGFKDTKTPVSRQVFGLTCKGKIM
ncbi:hypothetical protein HYC85_025939 [Camellia sinensis]|uniref:Uncharacterized protein n=1 Tax=Camellia sinensis TaxID=4442 RepID=A0A7J7G261_CAMSI|nr:hypothetical protein HYC85_025939 [Camellia sinensis]